MNRPLTRPQDRKLRNRHGQLTASAFSLGAVERRHGAELKVSDFSGSVSGDIRSASMVFRFALGGAEIHAIGCDVHRGLGG